MTLCKLETNHNNKTSSNKTILVNTEMIKYIIFVQKSVQVH